MTDPTPLLHVNHLGVTFAGKQGLVQVVDDVSFTIKAGQTLGLVGESGCGKSITALAIMGLLPKPFGCISHGQMLFNGQDLNRLPHRQRQQLRGNEIAMIFQEPMSALNPVQTIGTQIMEVFQLHRPHYTKNQRKEAALTLLAKVGISDPRKRFDLYPHHLSGGMRQRVMIAIAICCEPTLLICDEPTTALDVTIAAQILHLLQELQAQSKMAMLFISHDLGVIAQQCDDVVVMYAGHSVEQSDVYQFFDKPRHPYSQGLMQAIPKLTSPSKVALNTIAGQVPNLHERGLGCPFANRCPAAIAHCLQIRPIWQNVTPSHLIACHRWQELTP